MADASPTPLPGDPEAVASRGWEVSLTGWEHVVELGEGTFGGVGAIYVDDRELVKAGGLSVVATDAGLDGSTTVLEHSFTLDGRPVVVRRTVVIQSSGHSVDTADDWSLLVDGNDLGVPGPIVGRPDRPAVGTSAVRRRRHLILASALFVAGIVAGSLVPLAAHRNDPTYVLVLGGLAALGLVAFLLATVLRARPGAAPLSHYLRERVLPFDAGVIVGAAASAAVGVGSRPGPTQLLLAAGGAAIGGLLVFVGMIVVTGMILPARTMSVGLGARILAATMMGGCTLGGFWVLTALGGPIGAAFGIVVAVVALLRALRVRQRSLAARIPPPGPMHPTM